MRAALQVGLIAAAATAGVLAGFGLGQDGALSPFAVLGRLTLGVPQNASAAAQSAATLAGIALHTVLAGLWGVLFVLVAGGARGARLALAAVLYALFVYALDSGLLPPLLRLGHGARAFPSQSAFLHLVLAAALGIGTWIASIDLRGR
jgi:hypothetical protein